MAFIQRFYLLGKLNALYNYQYPDRPNGDDPVHSQLPGKYTSDATQVRRLSNQNYNHRLQPGTHVYCQVNRWNTIAIIFYLNTVVHCGDRNHNALRRPDLQFHVLTTRLSHFTCIKWAFLSCLLVSCFQEYQSMR